MPTPSVVVEGEDEVDAEEDEWQPDTDGPPVSRGGRREPFVTNRPPASESEPGAYRPRRAEGILSEREAVYNEGPGGMRILAIAGGAAIVVLFIVLVAMAMGGDGNDRPASFTDDASPTSARGQGTVITIGSATPAPSASPSPNPSASPSPSGTPGSPTPDATGTAPAATPTKAVVATQPAATPTPTEEPTVTPNPTVAVTPFVPTPTMVVAPASFFSACPRAPDSTPNCGPGPWRVVCYPGGWFLDYSKSFVLPNPAQQPGWRTVTVPDGSLSNVLKACG